MSEQRPIVVAVTGASGAAYAKRLIEVLLGSGRTVMLTISPSGQQVMREELGLEIDLQKFDAAVFDHDSSTGELKYFHHHNFMAPIASGSHLTDGMVVCPCSGTTLSAIAHAASGNLIQRAAEVHLKERRKLILVPRETPLSLPQLDNMAQACRAGAVILPAAPGWYHGVQSVEDLIDFVVARVLDQLGVEHSLTKRWGENSE